MQTVDERLEAQAEEGVRTLAVTPLAFPLLVGPAEIAVMITLTNDVAGWDEKGMLVCSAMTTAALVAATLTLAVPISRLLGKTGINVVTRVMALFVATIGVNFVMTGLRNQFPVLLS